MNDLPKHALSVRQPWAWAILHAGKRLENRSQAAIDHGMKAGPVCLHAAKGMSRDEYEGARSFINAAINRTNYPDLEVPKPCDLIRGGVIGVMRVTGFAKCADDVDNNPWFMGPRALILANVRAIEPIASVGALGYFEWKPGGELDSPKPWMSAWPEKTTRSACVKAVTPTTQDELFPAPPQREEAVR